MNPQFFYNQNCVFIFFTGSLFRIDKDLGLIYLSNPLNRPLNRPLDREDRDVYQFTLMVSVFLVH